MSGAEIISGTIPSSAIGLLTSGTITAPTSSQIGHIIKANVNTDTIITGSPDGSPEGVSAVLMNLLFSAPENSVWIVIGTVFIKNGFYYDNAFYSIQQLTGTEAYVTPILNAPEGDAVHPCLFAQEDNIICSQWVSGGNQIISFSGIYEVKNGITNLSLGATVGGTGFIYIYN